MSEWVIDFDPERAKELENCFAEGPILDDNGMRYLIEEEFDRFNGLKIEIFSNEHPPPHFRVIFQGQSNNFTISDCSPLNGNALEKYFKNIKKWHKKNKEGLIAFWNEKRPSNCPVGKFKE